MKEKKGEELVLLAAGVAINIAKEADADELQILSDFLAMVAASLLAIVDTRNKNACLQGHFCDDVNEH